MSQDVMKTAFTVFPYGLRVGSFVSVSNTPIRLDRDGWLSVLRNYRIDGRLVLDPGIPAGQAGLDQLASYAESLTRSPSQDGLETRESVLSRIPAARVITDDNMLPEVRRLYLY